MSEETIRITEKTITLFKFIKDMALHLNLDEKEEAKFGSKIFECCIGWNEKKDKEMNPK